MCGGIIFAYKVCDVHIITNADTPSSLNHAIKQSERKFQQKSVVDFCKNSFRSPFTLEHSL